MINCIIHVHDFCCTAFSIAYIAVTGYSNFEQLRQKITHASTYLGKSNTLTIACPPFTHQNILLDRISNFIEYMNLKLIIAVIHTQLKHLWN